MKIWLTLLPLLTTACVGTTGSDLVDFSAYASGPPKATHAFEFHTSMGFDVTLTQANVHIGGIYLTASPPNPSSADTSCINPGRYVGEVPGSIDMDALNPAPQPFSVPGSGTSDRALTGEVWLVGNSENVNAMEDTAIIVAVVGTVKLADGTYPFQGNVTIGSNRTLPVSDPSQPGLNPICKRRIVSPIPITSHLALQEGGSLFLEVDPRAWFANVDFSQLSEAPSALYTIPDNDDDSNGRAFFHGILSSSGVYTFSTTPPQ